MRNHSRSDHGPSYSKELDSAWLSGTWRKRDVLWWVGVSTAVPVLGRAALWAMEKSYNCLTPYQVRAPFVGPH